MGKKILNYNFLLQNNFLMDFMNEKYRSSSMNSLADRKMEYFLFMCSIELYIYYYQNIVQKG